METGIVAENREVQVSDDEEVEIGEVEGEVEISEGEVQNEKEDEIEDEKDGLDIGITLSAMSLT